MTAAPLTLPPPVDAMLVGGAAAQIRWALGKTRGPGWRRSITQVARVTVGQVKDRW